MVEQRRQTLVVVGNGLAGCRVLEEILARDPERYTLVVFGEEPALSYNRLQLSALLSGTRRAEELLLRPATWYDQHAIRLHTGVHVEQIDRQQRRVVGRPIRTGRNAGRSFTLAEPYDKLILATGSRPIVPPVAEGCKRNVFVFRTLADCAAIAEVAPRAQRAVVLGGGLLGLEVAQGLLTHGCAVTILEAGPRLMAQHLDATAAGLLRQQLEKLGVRVLLRMQARRFLGTDAVEAIDCGEGLTLPADLVVLTCGNRPNMKLARDAGLRVQRGIIVDDLLRTSDPDVFAVGECAEHSGYCYGLVEPVQEQARVLADVLTARGTTGYQGSRPAIRLKVSGVDLAVMGESTATPTDAQVLVHTDPERGLYRKLVLREGRLAGAIVLGESTSVAPLVRLHQSGNPVPEPSLDSLLRSGQPRGACADEDPQICTCNRVTRSEIVQAIRSGATTMAGLEQSCRAGTGCGSCRGQLGELLQRHTPGRAQRAPRGNRIELLKQEKDGLDSLPDILRHAERGIWQDMSDDDKQRSKWHGLFFGQQTPGHFMLRLRFTCGRTNAQQLRVIADLSDEYGRGFCDLTTRQQIQMRWFTIGNVPEIWRRLAAVGLSSKQTGMDNVRGVCGCPVSGLSPHEWLDGSQAAEQLTAGILDNRAFTNLPRKFNVTITGCVENCCQAETQDLALVPSYRELEGAQVRGFNILLGGKQGSGGYQPAVALDVFTRPEDAAALCGHAISIYRDHGNREARMRARLSFLVQDRGVAWFRDELERRCGRDLLPAGKDLRKKQTTDHLGIHPQKAGRSHDGPPLYYMGLLVPVGRITTAQLRGVADLADRYGTGDIRLTPQQNLIILNIPEDRLGALTEEPLLQELSFNPSPVMRGLVSCVGSDYCHFALIETKGWALKVAQELDRRVAGRPIAPLTIHWSGCPAGCGLHQIGTIGLQGCRSRIGGDVVDAAHVYVNGRAGPHPRTATDLMYDIPCNQLADALEPLVNYLPRS